MHSLRRVNHSIRFSVSHLQRTSFLIDVLQVCWLFDACAAYKVKVQKIEIFTVGDSVTHSKPFCKRFYLFLFVGWLITWLVLQCSFIGQLFVRCIITDGCEWTLVEQFSPSDGKCLFHFAVKRTTVLSILCDSGHLSCRYPYGCTPLKIMLQSDGGFWWRVLKEQIHKEEQTWLSMAILIT